VDPRPAEHVGRRARGFTTIQYVSVVALSLLLLVLVGNLLVDLYARGAIRDALDEGVRAAVVAGADAGDCRARAQEVLAGLLRGPTGAAIEVSCEIDGAVVVARARGSLPSWLPFVVPAWEIDLTAVAGREA